MFDPAGLRPFIANWHEAGPSLIERVHREAIGRVVDDQTQALLAQLQAYAGEPVAAAQASVHDAAGLPFIPISFNKDGKVLSYFSMVTTGGTPQTIATQELRIEYLYPADAATERFHVDGH